MQPWEDPRIANGMTAQLAKRRERIAAGEKPLGWKVGFGAPAAMERLNIKAGAVGYLMQRGLVLSGSTVSFAGWKQPAAECEIAVRMGQRPFRRRDTGSCGRSHQGNIARHRACRL